MKLIVGLGNPGTKYKDTRHNAGFKAVDKIAKHFGFEKFKKSDKFKSEIAKGQIVGENVILAKPQTFMNLSGQAVQSIQNFYKIPMDDLIVVYDDVNLSYGTLRIRSDGSAGGHKGMKSIIEQLGSQNFLRIRLGIHPDTPFKGALEDYVLGKLTANEKTSLKKTVGQIPSVVEVILKEGVEVAMNRYN